MITEFAPAKVNLSLHVTGQRDNGYHELDSLVVLVDVGDQVSVSHGASFDLTTTGPFGRGIPTDRTNLVAKAATALGAYYNRAVDVRVNLEKNLPPASGIGGGSSDAAATIRALCRLWGVAVPEAEFLATLGADVPVCMTQTPVRMRGIGDIITPAPLEWRGWMVLVNPVAEVATPTVFSKLVEKSNPGMVDLSMPITLDTLQNQRNDLQDPAISAAPVIADVLTELSTCDGVNFVRMSGSGATCFGLWNNQRLCDAAVVRIRASHPDWWATKCQIIG